MLARATGGKTGAASRGGVFWRAAACVRCPLFCAHTVARWVEGTYTHSLTAAGCACRRNGGRRGGPRFRAIPARAWRQNRAPPPKQSTHTRPPLFFPSHRRLQIPEVALVVRVRARAGGTPPRPRPRRWRHRVRVCARLVGRRPSPPRPPVRLPRRRAGRIRRRWPPPRPRAGAGGGPGAGVGAARRPPRAARPRPCLCCLLEAVALPPSCARWTWPASVARPTFGTRPTRRWRLRRHPRRPTVTPLPPPTRRLHPLHPRPPPRPACASSTRTRRATCCY